MLKLFLFFPFFLLSQEIFMLPDEAEHLNHSLNAQIKKAQSRVYIFSSFIDDYSTIKSIKLMAKKGVNISIITQEKLSEENKISHLALFQNISIYTLKTGFELKGTLLCIDDSTLFLLSHEMHHKRKKTDYSFALKTQEKCEQLFITLKKRSIKKE